MSYWRKELKGYKWNSNILKRSESFSSDSSGELEVFSHDGDSFSMDCTEVSVFEKSDQVGFCSLLECQNCRGLESEVSFEFLSDFPYQSLERQFPQQQVSRFLVLPYFSQGNCTRSESVRFLYSPRCCWSRFTSSLTSQLLTRSFLSCRFTSRLFCSCHFFKFYYFA